GGIMRVIAGEYRGVKGPANTYTPVNLWDIRLPAGHSVALDFPENYTTMLFTLQGSVKINNLATMNDAELAFFERKGKTITLTTLKDTIMLAINGEPINEPIAGYGPYVMNTEEEIRQAIADFDSGLFRP
ncbi:MAG: pirin family protein, partial [Methylobacter sp.]